MDRLTATPAGVPLGPLDQIADGAARSFVIELRAGRFHGFVVRRGEQAFGYVDRCPHMGLPLAQKLDDYVAAGQIACSWHGALFDVETGACRAGPCPGTALTPWPVRVEDGTILTG
jgi:nitrite reductase/ring-hydroxylating ferredoxin subunit